MDTTILCGRSCPLGATVCQGGVNFSVFAKGNTAVQLLLFDHADDAYPSRTITLDPVTNRSAHYWHLFVPGIGIGQIYGYRVDGSFAPEQGLRFDPQKILLDPYGRAIARPPNYSRVAASVPGDNCATAMKSVVTNVSQYNWEGDEPLRRPFSHTVIYEMHVAGFTKHPSSGVDPAKRGTYAGLIGKIPYLQDLGVTAVELQPVFQFDEQDAPAGLTNYWGYSPLWFELPPIPADESRPWRRWLDTFLEAPDDICVFSNARLVRGSSYLVNPRSIVGLARIADPATSTTEFCLTETE